MCALSNRSTPISDSGLGSKNSNIAGSSRSSNEIKDLIRLVNKKYKLVSILQNSYNIKLERAPFDEWSKPIICPFSFHKGGNERTGSFGYNFVTDSFHCFGCQSSGGTVEFLAYYEGIDRILIAERLYRDIAGYDIEELLEEDENPRIELLLFGFSKFIQQLIQKHKSDSNILKQIEKVTWWFDNYLNAKAPRNKIYADELEQRIQKAQSLLEKYS